MKNTHKSTVLAIYPEHGAYKIFDRMPPLGMAWIAAVVIKAGYSIHLVDGQIETVDAEKLTQEIKPALALLGGSSHCRFDAFAYASAIKRVSPFTTVVYGGPHASFTSDDTLNTVQDIDIIVHGEGEYVTLDLLKWKESGSAINDLEKIKGIAYRKDGGVVSTGWRDFIKDLDMLPFPARDILPMQSYGMTLEYLNLPAMHIMTARGCPFECSFCSASKMFGASYAMRSPKNVVDEIELLVKKYGIKGLKIFDSTFTINRKHVIGFCEELESRGLVMPWECEIRVGSVDRSLLERMQKAGCYYVDIGIESADQKVLEST